MGGCTHALQVKAAVHAFYHAKDEIVVIDFFDGNIDRPFVTGRIHEAERNPTKFDIKGQLPDTKKLSGIRLKKLIWRRI